MMQCSDTSVRTCIDTYGIYFNPSSEFELPVKKCVMMILQHDGKAFLMTVWLVVSLN